MHSTIILLGILLQIYLVLLNNLISRDKVLLNKVIDDLLDTLFNREFVGLDMNFGIFRCLIRGRDAGEFLDFTSLSLLIKTLGIALFNNIKRSISKNLKEGNISSFVKSSGRVTIGSVRTNESSNSNSSSISE
jgi:hypothetical protein